MQQLLCSFFCFLYNKKISVARSEAATKKRNKGRKEKEEGSRDAHRTTFGVLS